MAEYMLTLHWPQIEGAPMDSCSDGVHVRSWRGIYVREYSTRVDRNYWHPCTKVWVGQCRSKLGVRATSHCVRGM